MTAALPAVPPLWSGATIACIGTGPSLTAADVADLTVAGISTIAVNCACEFGISSVIYAADAKWWQAHQLLLPRLSRLSPQQQHYALQHEAAPYGPTVLQQGHATQLETRPTHLARGGHSGYQAINLAFHLGGGPTGGPRDILLLGYDMQVGSDGAHHAAGVHSDGTFIKYAYRMGAFVQLAADLAAYGVRVINLSRQSAIPASTFPRQSLDDYLACRRADRAAPPAAARV